MGRASKDKRDIYYRKAKEEGYRARSAYKLLQIDEEFGIFRGVTRAVDLCAAPGSWCQVLATRLSSQREKGNEHAGNSELIDRESRIVAVDLQEISPIPGVLCIQGDITTRATADEVIAGLGGKKAQLVVCDGAPDVTGLHDLDEYMQHQLLFAAMNITACVLEERGSANCPSGGIFVSKLFRGSSTPLLCNKLQQYFESVCVVKPKSSRNASMESFVICHGFTLRGRPPPTLQDPLRSLEEVPADDPSPIGSEHTRRSAGLPMFLECGSINGFDADSCYTRSSYVTDENKKTLKSLQPIQPPIQTPYSEVCSGRRTGRSQPAKQQRYHD